MCLCRILYIVLFSFNQPRGNFNIEWQQFTLDNWKEPFADRALTDALWVSLKIATISTVVSTLLGSLIAIALSRHQFKGDGPFNLFLVLPVTTPEIVLWVIPCHPVPQPGHRRLRFHHRRKLPTSCSR